MMVANDLLTGMILQVVDGWVLCFEDLVFGIHSMGEFGSWYPKANPFFMDGNGDFQPFPI